MRLIDFVPEYNFNKPNVSVEVFNTPHFKENVTFLGCKIHPNFSVNREQIPDLVGTDTTQRPLLLCNRSIIPRAQTRQDNLHLIGK